MHTYFVKRKLKKKTCQINRRKKYTRLTGCANITTTAAVQQQSSKPFCTIYMHGIHCWRRLEAS
eukprot:SAG11_NODE_19723_length_460_cov_0.847645_2_plen_63_part_01